MRRLIVVAVLLAGCASLTARRPATSKGWAGVESFRCSQRMMGELGYVIQNIDHSAEYLRAMRNFGQENGTEYVRGYLTVSVEEETTGPRLVVSGERYADGTGIALPPRPDPPTLPPGRPPTYDTTSTTGRFRPGGSRRVQAGATGMHARQVVQRCARVAAA